MVSESTDTDFDSIDFRKCWALGEACYYLKKFYSKNNSDKCLSKESDSKLKFYMSRLEAINNICKSLGVEDGKINYFLTKLRQEMIKDKPNIENLNFKFDFDLEYLLIGNLIGKDPRYEHIFRAAKHCQGLYGKYEKDDDYIDKFRNDLGSLKNFVSRDKRNLIESVVDKSCWGEVQDEYKNLYDENKVGDNSKTVNGKESTENNSSIIELKKPEFIGVVNRIGGLILGVIEIYDILRRWDRITWILICYVIPTIIFGSIIYLIFNNPGLIEIAGISEIMPDNPNSYLPLLVALIPFVIGIILFMFKTVSTSWKKFASYFELLLAIQRLKHPKHGWITGFKRAITGVKKPQKKSTKNHVDARPSKWEIAK